MCTVSVVPAGDGFRMACNRDERRTRPIAQSPHVHHVGGRRTLWPCDPQSGGTWIGVNDSGLAMALLNRSAGVTAPPDTAISRGTLIPQLLAEDSLDSAIERATIALTPRGDGRRFEPFTLVMLRCGRAAIVEHRAGLTEVETCSLDTPLLFTSSSLGDHLVDEPRRQLFLTLLKSSPRPFDAQVRLHLHRWPDRPGISVCMTRPDALTVSHTVVDVSCGKASLAYTAPWESCSLHSC